MAYLLEYWLPLAVVIGTLLGSFTLPIIGYFRKPKQEQASTIHGAVMMDSAIGAAVVAALERIALAAERIDLHLKETADSEAEDRRVRAAVEAAKVKWDQEHQR